MSRKTLIAITLVLSSLGCVEVGPPANLPGHITCNVSAECADEIPECAKPICDDGICGYVIEIDGMQCGDGGACNGGECIEIAAYPTVCDGAASECESDSDCFIRQCTRSACVQGACVHVPYQNDIACLEYDTAVGIFAGTCQNCACVNSAIRGPGEALPR